MPRGSYVWRELCMEGVLSEGVLSAHRDTKTLNIGVLMFFE